MNASVALLNLDNTTFPNLAMMKVSAHHKLLKDSVVRYNRLTHFCNGYDLVYAFSVFSWSSKKLVTPDMICGGTGFDITTKLPDAIDKLDPDYSLYPEFESSLGFLTRGCPRKCSWCVVPKKEGNIKPYRDIEQIAKKNQVVLMDNNVLACEYGHQQIEKIIKLNLKVDFNQGLDARLIDDKTAWLLAQVRWLKPLRMSCDTDEQLKYVRKAAHNLRKYKCTPKNFFVYVLVKDIESALFRVQSLAAWGMDPFAQPYRSPETQTIASKFKPFARWVNHKAIFKTVPWKEYKSGVRKKQKSQKEGLFQ